MEESPSARSRVYSDEHVETQGWAASSRDDGMSITHFFAAARGQKNNVTIRYNKWRPYYSIQTLHFLKS